MVINIADILRVLPLAWRLSDKDWRIDRVFFRWGEAAFISPPWPIILRVVTGARIMI